MAQDTLNAMARNIQAYCPSVPYLLAERWIRDRYRQIAEGYLWSFKMGEGTFFTYDAYSTGTITVTNASTTVTGSGTAWDSSFINRQLVISGYVFNITAVASGTSMTIDRAWYGSTASGQTYRISKAYITPTDTDFHSFISIVDPIEGKRLRQHFTSMDLDAIDPQRSSTSSSPCLIASRTFNSSNVPRYELWPHPTTLRQYNYIYEKRVTDLSLTNTTPPPIIRSDILVKGALADLSRWPGTRETPNPFYDPYFIQWKSREAEFAAEVNNILVADQNTYLTDIVRYTECPMFPIDSRFMQNHAF